MIQLFKKFMCWFCGHIWDERWCWYNNKMIFFRTCEDCGKEERWSSDYHTPH